MRAVFNVGGTRFETCVSTIRNNRREPTDLLNMLLDRHEGEIFIDRDPSSFQKILNIYRGSGNVETNEIELDFFGLAQPKRVPTKRERLEEIIIQERVKFYSDKKRKKEALYDKYAEFLHMLLESGSLCFCYADNKPDDFPKQPSTWKGVYYPAEYFRFCNDEYFREYVKSLGYSVNVQHVSGQTATKFNYPPASLYTGYTNRHKSTITIQVYFV